MPATDAEQAVAAHLGGMRTPPSSRITWITPVIAATSIAGTETRLNERMRKLESRLLGWAFAFWVGQFAVLIGILFAFFRN